VFVELALTLFSLHNMLKLITLLTTS